MRLRGISLLLGTEKPKAGKDARQYERRNLLDVLALDVFRVRFGMFVPVPEWRGWSMLLRSDRTCLANGLYVCHTLAITVSFLMPSCLRAL